MERWIALTSARVLFLFLIACHCTIPTVFSMDATSCPCSLHKSHLGGDLVLCANVTATYFRYTALVLNRTHWLACDRCHLPTLDQNIFNFDQRNNVSYLNLTANHISILEANTFRKLPLLKVLILRGNRLVELRNDSFLGMKRLVQLDLSQNHLIGIYNATFLELPNLDILGLTHNRIKFLEADAFAGLIYVKYLYLSHNGLQALESNTFKHLINLKILYLENNGIIEISPYTFDGLKNLNFLYLNNNSITFLFAYSFKQLTSLVDLQLRYNNLTEIESSTFNGLKNLKYLYLGQNYIDRVQQYGFIGLSSLIILDLVKNQFNQLSLNTFKGLNALQALWLQGNNITAFDFNTNDEVLASVLLVDLEENGMEDFNYSLLYNKMPNVEQLMLGENLWECEFFRDMKDFFDNRNVSVCVTSKCTRNESAEYLDKVCLEDEVILSTDSVLNSATNNLNRTFALFILLYILKKTLVIIYNNL